MKEMKRNDFIEMVKQLKGALIVSLIAKTVPAMRKTGEQIFDREVWPMAAAFFGRSFANLKHANPFLTSDKSTGKKVWHSSCHKVAYVNGIIGWDYSNAVNNQRAREDNTEHFKANPRKWGTRLDNSLVYHKGQYYLELKVQRSLGHAYFDHKGKEIPKEIVEPWLTKRTEGARQEVEKTVILRDYKIASLTQVKMNGEIYSLTD